MTFAAFAKMKKVKMVSIMAINSKDTLATSQVPQEVTLFGCMKGGRIQKTVDVTEPLDEVWEVLAL